MTKYGSHGTDRLSLCFGLSIKLVRCAQTFRAVLAHEEHVKFFNVNFCKRIGLCNGTMNDGVFASDESCWDPIFMKYCRILRFFFLFLLIHWPVNVA